MMLLEKKENLFNINNILKDQMNKVNKLNNTYKKNILILI